LSFVDKIKKMSFDGFSDVEIQKITTMKARKPEVKLAKNIPCHKKVRQFDAQNDENHNRNDDDSFKVQEPPTQSEIKLSTVDEDLEKTVPKTQTETDICDDKKSRFQDFELQRKLMEEQNKMKRNILQDAISKHAEKTQAESKKLNEIKEALAALDSELSNDVAILRKQIETATLQFNTIEKRYGAIEKAFLQAKQDLYQAHEKKEMLTEHLYTIIAHNEDRKAKRLSELMAKVGLSLDENGS